MVQRVEIPPAALKACAPTVSKRVLLLELIAVSNIAFAASLAAMTALPDRAISGTHTKRFHVVRLRPARLQGSGELRQASETWVPVGY